LILSASGGFIRRIAKRFSAIGALIFHRKVLKRLLLTILLVLFYNPVYIIFAIHRHFVYAHSG